MLWNKHEHTKNIIFIIMTILIIILITQMKSIALLAFASFVLACSLNPLVNRLSNHKFISRGLAATIVITTVILIVVLFLIPLGSVAIQEIQQLISNIPEAVEKGMSFLNNKSFMGKTLMEYIDFEALASTSSQYASDIFNKSLDITFSIFGGITVLFTMGVIVFYLLCEENIMRDTVIKMFPPKIKDRAKEVYEAIEQKVGGYIMAQIALMSSVGIATALGLLAVRLEYAVLIGLIAGILDIIPIVGPSLAFIIGIIVALQQGWVVAVLTAIVFLLVQWAENNFLRPLIFGKLLNLHPIIIIFAFLIAAQFLGIWGVILSPAIAALIITLFDELYLKTINKPTEEEKK
ncbi:AI-2E family transporter [bacterium]|nr:AI-2E family transporter [bacterium]